MAKEDGDSEKDKDIVTKVDTFKVSDKEKNLDAVAKSYVDQVFLDKDTSNKLLATDTKTAEKEFDKSFTEAFTEDLGTSGANYKPSQTEIDKVLKVIKSTNVEKGKVDYKVIEMFPNSAIVSIKPEVVSLENANIEDLASDYSEKTEKSNPDADYDTVLDGAVKYVLEQLPSKISSSKLETSSYMDDEGYKLVLNKDKSGNWKS